MAGEGLELSPRSGTSDDGVPSSTKLVDLLHFYYAWVLFAVFLVAFVVNTILTAEPSAEARGPIRLGPGGKPLPPTSARKNKEALEKKKKDKEFSQRKKWLFFYLSAALLLTFFANGVEIIAHSLTKSENGWWCGEDTAVSISILNWSPSNGLFNRTVLDIRLCISILLQRLPHLSGRHNSITEHLTSNYMGSFDYSRDHTAWGNSCTLHFSTQGNQFC
tara:strand:+ start:295 stop:951 length:657 start_codon:yes stop_codon:yes gene_type:complete